MIRIRPAGERGYFDHGWLKTHHTFAFGDYHDPRHVQFRALRVMNEDWVAPGQGFGMHPHRDMEIVTYVLEGSLKHRDSLGTGSVIRAGEFQRMSAGTGILHSEFNPSDAEAVHLYQIWLLPDRRGLEPGYEQKRIAASSSDGLVLVASPEGGDGALTIHQDARIFRAAPADGQQVVHDLAEGRHAWLQVLSGQVSLNGHELKAGDGAAVSDERHLEITGRDQSEVLLFDLA
jgi:redox-sensitive bicupin YhaK (pirin superfamily)